MVRTVFAGAIALLLALGGPAGAGEPVPAALSVLGELAPDSLSGFEAKAGFTRRAQQAVPIEELAALFGFDARRFEWAYRSGGYRGSIAPNLVATVRVPDAERSRVLAFALAWMYVYRQDAVPVFGRACSGSPAVRIAFEKPLTPPREREMYAALITALGQGAGYTRMGEREIVVIDFEGRPDFGRGMAAFSAALAASNRVTYEEAFTAAAVYRAHDWGVEPEGKALLAEIDRVFPTSGVEAQLRRMRLRYEQVARPQTLVGVLPASHGRD